MTSVLPFSLVGCTLCRFVTISTVAMSPYVNNTHSTMSSNHIGAVFNNSCLKVPVNPSNRLPSPSYERKCLSGIVEDGNTHRERTRKTAVVSGPRRTSWSSGRNKSCKGHSPKESDVVPEKDMNEHFAKETLESFLNFYESIPDYGDVNHLSDREFYLKVQHLKEKRRSYLKILDANSYDNIHEPTQPFDHENEMCQKLRKPNSLTNKPPKLLNGSGIVAKRYEQAPVQNYDTKQYNTDLQSNNSFWDKYEQKAETVIPTPETASVTSIDIAPLSSKTEQNDTENLIHITDVSDSEDLKSKSEANTNDFIRKDKREVISSPLESHKFKLKTQKNGTNKIRDTYSASSNKQPSCVTVDSSSSVIDSVWDGFSVEEYFPKSDYISDSDSGPEEALPFSHSLPSSPVLKHNKNVAWKEPKITIPKPFKMTIREEENRHLSTLKCQLYNPIIEDREEHKPFRANPVPLHARLPLYDKIMAEQEKRRKKLRRQCIAELKSQMKPFNFVKREEERRRLKLCCSTPELRDITGSSKPFKARPVPKNLFSSYVYQRMREDEFYRSLKKKVRAEELLKSSSLPPSMAAREEIAKAHSLSADLLEDSGSDRPKRRRHKIPNYKKSHDLMRRELEARWNEQITTSPQTFHLKTEHRGRKSARFLPVSDSSSPSPYEGYSPFFYERLRPHSALSITPNRNNLAAILRIQSTRQRIEREVVAKQEEFKRKETARLKEYLTRRKPAWRALNYDIEEDLALRVQSRREEERLRKEEHQQRMELMLDRVQQIPTLFERQTQHGRKHKMEKRKYASPRRYSDGSISRQNSPEFYVCRDDTNQAPNYDDKNTKLRLKVSINENTETIDCSSDEDNNVKHEPPQVRVSNTTKNEPEDKNKKEEEEDGDEYSSIHEDITAEKSSDEGTSNNGETDRQDENGNHQDENHERNDE